MRTFVIGGCLLLLLLTTAAYVGFRRSRAAAAPPASFARESLPTLCFEPERVDLGALAPGEARRVDVPWRRGGPGDLGVRAVHTDCGCVVACPLPPRLEEGQRGVLFVEIRAPPTPGPFKHTVRVVTDHPPDDVVRFDVMGLVAEGSVGPQGSLGSEGGQIGLGSVDGAARSRRASR